VRKWIIILICLLPAIAGAATYYVNRQATEGGNGQTEGTAWNTLSDIAGIVAGDSVLLEQGDEWRESLTFGFNGTAVNRITLGTYGTGANPLLKGSDLVTGWTSSGGTQWQEYGDTGNKITIAAGSVSTAALPQSADAYVYKDFGAAYFNGDFTHKFQVNVTTASDGAYQSYWMLSNFIDSYNHHQGTGLETDDALYFLTNRGGAVYNVSFRILEDGTIRQYNTVISAATTYFVTVTRDDDAGNNSTGLVTVYLNTGAYYPGGTNISTTLIHCAAGEQNDYRYCYAVGTAHTGTSYTTTAALSNLDLGAGVVDFTEAGGSNQWTAALATAPTQVFFDNTRGAKKATAGEVDAQYDWYWASNLLYTYAASDPDTLYVAPGVEASVRPTDRVSGILRITGDYVTVQDIDVSQSYSRGIEAEQTSPATADYVTLDGCTVEWSKDGGIVAPNGLATNLTVEDCNVAYNNTGQVDPLVGGNRDTGMEALSLEGTNVFTARRNLVHDNFREGIDAKYGATGGDIYHNKTYANGDVTNWEGIIQIYLDGATNTDVYQNLIYGDAAAPKKDAVQGVVLGIEQDVYPTNNINIYSNVFYDCSEGVRFWTGSGVTVNLSNIYIVNNTFVSCSGRGVYWWNPNNNVAAPVWIRNNIFWQDAGSAILDDTTNNDGIAASTITHNGFALGQTSETKGTDYREPASAGFTNLAGNDFSLTASSGFIGYGYTAGTPYDIGLSPASTWTANVLDRDQDLFLPWEIGAYPYASSGGFEDFLSYTETGDTRSQLAYTSARATGACDQDTGARLWKDFGVDYFGADFTHQWTWYGNPDSLWTANQTSYQGLTDTEGAFNVVTANAASHSVWVCYTKGADTTITATLRVYDGTTQEGSDTSNSLVTNQLYYMQLGRDTGTGWQVKVWTGSFGGTLVDTLSVTGATSPGYRYLEAWSARSDGSIGSKTNWYIENLNLGATQAGTPVSVFHLLRRRR
jgi:hypothetical protein